MIGRLPQIGTGIGPASLEARKGMFQIVVGGVVRERLATGGALERKVRTV